MFLIKLGGSVITDKARASTFKPDVVASLAQQLATTKQAYILMHGAGSFGHVLAKQHQLNQGYHNDEQYLGFAQTHVSVQNLNSLVLEQLHQQKIPAIGLPPHAFLQLDDHQPKNVNLSMFDEYLDTQFTPVTYGDVVLDKSLTFSICSGDLLIQLLAQKYKPTFVIFVMDEDGIYTSNPKEDPKATLVQKTTVKELDTLTTTANKHADVTSGMKGKINTIQRLALLGIDTFVVNGNYPERLHDILQGKTTVCTHVLGETS